MLKGFLVGMCASAPIGPIAILVVQKSLSKGHMAGFVSGLGASVVDTLYAFIAIFALAFAQKLIEAHQNNKRKGEHSLSNALALRPKFCGLHFRLFYRARAP